MHAATRPQPRRSGRADAGRTQHTAAREQRRAAGGRDWESFTTDVEMQGIAERVLKLVRAERGLTPAEEARAAAGAGA